MTTIKTKEKKFYVKGGGKQDFNQNRILTVIGIAFKNKLIGLKSSEKEAKRAYEFRLSCDECFPARFRCVQQENEKQKNAVNIIAKHNTTNSVFC